MSDRFLCSGCNYFTTGGCVNVGRCPHQSEDERDDRAVEDRNETSSQSIEKSNELWAFSILHVFTRGEQR